MKDDRYPWVALSVTTVGALLASVQSSALIIALPDVMTGLNASFLTIMWVLLGYLLVTTALVPVVGRLADMFGRKHLYNAGFAIFTVASLLAGFARPEWRGWDLVAYRLVQGVGGALLMANSTAIVTDAFRGSGRVGLGLGVNQIAGAAGFLLGPVIGGALAAVGWQWVFWVNVPIGLFGTAWGMMRLRQTVPGETKPQFDWPGALLFASGLGAFLMGLSLVAFPLLSTRVVWTLIVGGLALLALFLWVETRAAHPMMDLTMFRDRVFAVGSLSALLNSLARGAVLFILIFFLQGPFGKDPLVAGFMMTPFGAAFLLVGPLSGWLSDRWGSRALATAGLLVSAAGLAGLATVTDATPYWLLAFWMVVIGGGSGLFNSPNMNSVMSHVKGHERGMAAGVVTMLVNTGQMLSIAIAFPLVLSKIPEQIMMRIFLFGGGMAGAPDALAAFLHGMHVAFLLAVAITLLAAAVSWLRPQARSRDAANEPAS